MWEGGGEGGLCGSGGRNDVILKHTRTRTLRCVELLSLELFVGMFSLII